MGFRNLQEKLENGLSWNRHLDSNMFPMNDYMTQKQAPKVICVSNYCNSQRIFNQCMPQGTPPATQNFSVSFPITGKTFLVLPLATSFAHKEIMITLNYIIAK